MATLVSFHAHPDDESIQTGGTIAKAALDGHRVVLVFATKGEHGEVDEGFLDPGETLGQRREQECLRSAEVLGAERVEFLGHVDSGMIGTPENDLDGSFWSIPVDVAAERLASILQEEEADVLTVYDSDGAYGHPDHIQVHRVGVRAAELAGTPRVFEATMNRDHFRRVVQQGIESGAIPGDEVPDVSDTSTFGRPEAVITTCVDVRLHLPTKRASMAAHASQISETSFFLQMPEEAFEASFGWEWFIRHGVEPTGEMDDDLFTGLA
ncbi:MAG: PIG-L family deacetylase [Acidimicrobiales bacterium]|nr:PIG-L family deacetylase [Acidimicrobiales bacterium]